MEWVNLFKNDQFYLPECEKKLGLFTVNVEQVSLMFKSMNSMMSSIEEMEKFVKNQEEWIKFLEEKIISTVDLYEKSERQLDEMRAFLREE